jgi:Fe2+ or Zn2+ uptake regulation protein
MLPTAELAKACRAQGLKLTPQRLAIFDCLHAHPGHPSALEMFQAVRRRHPTVSFATVYNTLEMLVRMGELREVTLAGELHRRYDRNTEPHQHAVCRQCGRVLDVALPEAVPGGALWSAALREAKLDVHRFEADALRIEFSGTCAACAASPL